MISFREMLSQCFKVGLKPVLGHKNLKIKSLVIFIISLEHLRALFNLKAFN